MKIVKGDKGTHLSWQDDFPKEAKCKCGGVARIALSAIEENEDDGYVSHLHENNGKGGYWPHDAIAFSVYFCKECMEPVILYNQA